MDKKIEKFMLKESRHYCEFPDVSGLPVCRAKATHILELKNGNGGTKIVAVCDDCANYILLVKCMELCLDVGRERNQKGETNGTHRKQKHQKRNQNPYQHG
jgi:hypothetical protein